MAAFQVFLYGRFWVITEDKSSTPRAEVKKPEPKTPSKRSAVPKNGEQQPTYSVGTATGSIVNQGSPNNGSQTVNNVDTSRRLTQQQIAAMKVAAQKVCATLPMINVTASNGNQEAQRYAYDFIEALRGGGCNSRLGITNTRSYSRRIWSSHRGQGFQQY